MEDYNPYNDKNIEISLENIKRLLETYNVFYTINNIDLCTVHILFHTMILK